MINRTEQDVMKNWKDDFSSPLVSICTITYNHEKYIAEALDSFLMQETDFPFEIVVDDDCSADGTAGVVKQYMKKFPNIIKARLREKNVGAIANDIGNTKRAKGKYIAYCEGDDYWTDKQKLQYQIEKMAEYSNCQISFHPARVVEDETMTDNVMARYLEDDKVFDIGSVIRGNGGFCPTPSIIIEKAVIDALPDFYATAPAGDYVLQVFGSVHGGALYIDKTMSAYRVHPQGVWTSIQGNSSALKKFATDMSQTLLEMDRFFQFQYHEEVMSVMSDILVGALNNKNIRIQDRTDLYSRCKKYLSAEQQIVQEQKLLMDGQKSMSANKEKRLLTEKQINSNRDSSNLVSIVIRCYNQAQYLEESVESVINQTYSNIEIIIVNDGSSDNTQDIALALQKRYPKEIKLITQDNRGVSQARNRGIKQACGEYIVPLDADDKLDKKMISQCMASLIKNNVDIIYGDLQRFGDDESIRPRSPFTENNILYESLHSVTSLYRKKVWEKVNGYKQNMCEGFEDWEFWVNAYKNNFRFLYLPEVLFYYRIKEVSRDTLAEKQTPYLHAKIVMNHPELYMKDHVIDAIPTIKESEKLAEFYFSYDKNLSKDEKKWIIGIGHYIENYPMEAKQILTIFNKKVGLCTLDILEEDVSIQKMQEEMAVDFIIFYAPLRYSVLGLKSSDFTWCKEAGIIKAHGTVFPFVYKSIRENPELQSIAKERLLRYLDKISGTESEVREKQRLLVIRDKLVTVITRTKDRSLFIPRVFETIVQQTYRPLEWIIVNDNGERIDELIETLKGQYSSALRGIEIHLINKTDSTTMEAASNTGLEHAHGVYIKLLDDDDTLDATCIAKQVYYMENEKLPNESGVICYTQHVFEKIEDKKIVYLNDTPMKLTPKNVTIADLAKYNQFTVHSFLYERDTLKEIGTYNEALPVLGDWEFNLRFIMKFDIGVIPEFLVNYHIREDSEGANRNTGPTEHQRYDAVIRNQLIRDEKKHPNISALISNASTASGLEGELGNILNNLKILMAKDQQAQVQNAQIKLREQQLLDSDESDLDIRDKAMFSLLQHRINVDSESADILREVALLFEKNGNIAMAKAVMTQALLQRPEGELIQTKVAEYSKLLDKKE